MVEEDLKLGYRAGFGGRFRFELVLNVFLSKCVVSRVLISLCVENDLESAGSGRERVFFSWI